MAIRLRLTKKWKIIVIAIFVLILGGSGTYLLWRTNQQETVAPSDSEAGGGAGACCNSAGCVAGWICDNKIPCYDYESPYPQAQGVPCGVVNGVYNYCRTGFICTSTLSCKPATALGTCVKDDNTEGPTEGTCSNKNTCEWPNVLFSSSGCACTLCNGQNGCTGNPPDSCSPSKSCPTGFVDCGSSVSHEEGGGCEKQTDIKCTVYHPDCNNPSNIFTYCKPKTSTNTCDSGEWLTKPTGSYTYCDPITYSAKAKDKDGIKQASVVAKLNGTARSTRAITNVTTTTLDISETLSTAENCLAEGTYTIDLSWSDTKGATSTACTLSTTFSVLGIEANPQWTISKKAVEQCTDDNKATISYTIKIKNTGDGVGSIDKIVDTLDSKVLASYITGTISEGGLFGSNQIVWELEGASESFTAGQEKIYTYSLLIPSANFGKYINTVTAYPTSGENFSDSESVLVDCIVDVPQTGIFDSTVVRIVSGIVLLIIGFNLHRINLNFSGIQTNIRSSIEKTSRTRQDNQSERRKKNFEKKIVKR